jgi:hypothetical protein
MAKHAATHCVGLTGTDGRRGVVLSPSAARRFFASMQPAAAFFVKGRHAMTSSHPYTITYFSDTMYSIADPDGNLIAVTTGPKAESIAQTLLDLLELMREAEAAGITSVEKLFSREVAKEPC